MNQTYHFTLHDEAGRVVNQIAETADSYESAYAYAEKVASKMGALVHGITYCDKNWRHVPVPHYISRCVMCPAMEEFGNENKRWTCKLSELVTLCSDVRVCPGGMTL